MSEIRQLDGNFQNQHPGLGSLAQDVDAPRSYILWRRLMDLGRVAAREGALHALCGHQVPKGGNDVEVGGHVCRQHQVDDFRTGALGEVPRHVGEQAHLVCEAKGAADAEVLQRALAVVNGRDVGGELHLIPEAQ